MPDYADFVARLKTQEPARRATLQQERRAQAMVSLRMDDVLASDGWTLYRKHLDVLRAQHQALLDDTSARILGDAVGETLTKLKWERATLDGIVKGIDLAMGLPAFLQTQAATVEAVLARQLDSPSDQR